MIIPNYWAEAKGAYTKADRLIVVRRFGWSDDSQQAAQQHAEGRLRDAIDSLQTSAQQGKVPLREKKVAYNGADGLPIREEVIDRQGLDVITRNGYGALCLNTPNVLFADIDSPTPLYVFYGCLAVVLCFVGSVGLAFAGYFLLALIPFGMGWLIPIAMRKLDRRALQSVEVRTLEQIKKALETRPGWGVRVYRTPLGFRVAVTHSPMDPQSPSTAAFFDELKSDPIYVRMCVRQNCFRARLTAKPWRCGVVDHIRPRGVWPIDPGMAKIREQWLQRYETAAREYASCRFLSQLGSTEVHPQVRSTIELHDALSQANTTLPLA